MRWSSFKNFLALERCWMFLLWIMAPLLIILALCWILFLVPANAYLRVERIGAIRLLLLSLLFTLPGAIAGGSYLFLVRDLRQKITELEEQLKKDIERAGLSIRLYPEGFGEVDYTLLTRLFHDCREVRLYPLLGGFSGTLVFQVASWDRQGRPQQPTVLKLGPRRKIEAEEQNHRNFVEPYIGTTVKLRGMEYEGRQGAIRFTYARMSRGRTLTFEKFYLDTERNSTDAVVVVIDEIFQNALRLWLEGVQPNPHSRLYQMYDLAEDWGKIRQAVSDLGFDPVADYFNCLEQRFPNPIKEAEEWFRVRQNREIITKESIVHGDLNSRNILIDSGQNVFVIDFAKTGRNHLLRDFCKLETEIKFCLTRLHCDDDIKQAIALEGELLFASGRPFTDLQGLLSVEPVANADPRLERAQRCIVALRQIACQAMGLQATEPAEQYYLGLLHYTLDALRYEQCDRNSRLYALISASLLCWALC
jgi:hypothetical protein